MSLIKWRPTSPGQWEFDDFDRFHGSYMPAPNKEDSGFVPAVDVYEDKDNVYVETQIAGIDPENIEVSIDKNALNIKGEGEKKSEIDDENYYRKEIRCGKFFRSIPLPVQVRSESARAEEEKGVLKVIIPKSSTRGNKKIRVDSRRK